MGDRIHDGEVAMNIARRAARMQSGYLYHYAFAMLLGLAGVVTWFLFVRT